MAVWCSFGGPGGCDREATSPDDPVPTCALHADLANPASLGAAEMVVLLRECIEEHGSHLRLHALPQQAIALRIRWAVNLIERLTA